MREATVATFSWRSPLGPLVVGPLVGNLFLILLVPGTILETCPLARSLAEGVRELLLALHQRADLKAFADSSSFPQVALLGSAIAWLTLPILVVTLLVLTEMGIRNDRWAHWESTRGPSAPSAKDTSVMLLSLPLFAAAPVIITMIPGDWSFASGLTSQSRVGFGLMLSFSSFALLQAANGCYAMLRAHLHFELRRRAAAGRGEE